MVRNHPEPPALRAVGLLQFNNGRLANQLYYTLQAYVRGGGSKYAVNNDRWVAPLSYLGCRALIASSKDCAGQKIHVEADPRQVMGRDFTMGDVTAFVRRFILTSDAYRNVSAMPPPDPDAVAVHVRNGDYLSNTSFNIFDRADYLTRALGVARRRFVGGGVMSAIHVFSDDTAAARSMLDGLFRTFSSNVVYMRPMSAEDDLMRLALYRNKVILNSTFGTWAGYIGDVLFDRGTRVVVPSAFHAVRGIRHDMGEIADPTWDAVEVSPVAYEGGGREAIVWSTDGENADCLLESMRSFDTVCDASVSFVVLTPRPDLDFSGLSRGVIVADPVPTLGSIGLRPLDHDSNRLRFARMYKLAIPLLRQLRGFMAVCSVDADVAAVDQRTWGMAVDSRSCWAFSALFSYPLRDCEVAGAADHRVDGMLCAHLVNRCCPSDIKGECDELVWSATGSSQRGYVNSGVLLWNVGGIDTSFYVRRLQAFWQHSRNNPGMFPRHDGDFINGFMRVDAGLSMRFNCIYSDKYNSRYVCAMHFSGQPDKLDRIRGIVKRNAEVRAARDDNK